MSTNRIIDAVHTIAGTLSSTLDQAEGMRRILDVAARCVDATGGSIWQHDAERRQLVCRHAVGERAGELIGFPIGDAEGIAGQVFQSCRARSDRDVARNPHHAHRVAESIGYETRSMVTVPLCYPGGTGVGVMQLVNKRTGEFTPEDVTVLEIVAGISAMSMHNAELAQRAMRSEALGYVAGFAHDIYNKIASSVTGLPTLRLLLDDVFAEIGEEAPPERVARLREDALTLVGFMEVDADLVYRYARFIARLARDLPLDTRFEESDLVETASGQALQLRRKARELGVTLRFGEDPPVICLHDRLLVGSAVYNLVNNALPETPGGTVVVSVREEGDLGVVEVRDTGRGMPPEVLREILRGHATSTKAGGSGIGTLIVKKVAEIHGGQLEGESAAGVGTTFRIRLPLQPAYPSHPGARTEDDCRSCPPVTVSTTDGVPCR